MTKKEKEQVIEMFLEVVRFTSSWKCFDTEKQKRFEDIIRKKPFTGTAEEAKAVLLSAYNAFLAGGGKGEVFIDWSL